jgi:hypothetical protein
VSSLRLIADAVAGTAEQGFGIGQLGNPCYENVDDRLGPSPARRTIG